ncbi:hypothetical protein [Peribacillus acanthi]|uniref:hypothetical protein n=1 Tax=Peribacillus acanthi TaxID=2171554 RepID=UPI000D3E9879|nr:hypothetical protein [Peribacillus acanthi]
MAGYLLDLTIVTVLVIGFTALNGVIVNGIGERFFGGKEKSIFKDHSAKTQTGWKAVGGKKN